jgi:hypothetical protein
MALFGRRGQGWKPPAPRCAFIVSCAGELPSLAALTGEPSSEAHSATPAVGKPYDVATGNGGTLELRVEEAERRAEHIPHEEVWPYVGLTRDLARRILEARYDVGLLLKAPGQTVADTVLEATKLADRLAELSDGCVNDLSAMRFFGPGTWRIPEPLAEIDVREHITVHAVPDERATESWVHTHGLLKFGRPEFEIHDVPAEMTEGTAIALNDMGQYVLAGALISPGETLGDRAAPLHARIGGRDRDHWEETPVLELVDIGEDGQPAHSGASRGLKAWWPEHFAGG